MAVFDLATFRLMRIGPQDRVGFGIEQRNARVAFRDFSVSSSVHSAAGRKLTFGNNADMVSAVETQDEIGLFETIRQLKTAPLVELPR